MRVLEINSVCGIRSTGRICTDIADVLAAQGHECRVAYGREDAPEKQRSVSVRIGTKWDHRFHGAMSRIFGFTGFYSAAATRRFLRWVDGYQPDVIHLHNIHGYYINIGLLFNYIKAHHIPVVWTLHDCWAFTGHCPHFTAAKCEQWKEQCSCCSQTQEYPGCLFKYDVAKNFDRKKALFTGVESMTLVTPSQWLANLTRASFLKDYPVKVINNGIDLSAFTPTESDFRERHGLTDKKLVLGVASAWDRRKGLEDFVELSHRLGEEYRVVLVGLAAKQMEAMPPDILCIERTNSVRELAEIYTAADVFVNPTHQDNYPTTNLEALACGTPVITYETGGSPESLAVHCGTVVPCGDLEALEAMLRKVVTDEPFSAENCRRRASAFDKWKQYEVYAELYKEMTKGK